MGKPNDGPKGPSPEEVQKAVDFFTAQEENDQSEFLVRLLSDWKNPLQTLERLYLLNTEERVQRKEEPHGLTSEQVTSILEAVILWADHLARNRALPTGRRRNTKRSPVAVFGLPKAASVRLIKCLIPIDTFASDSHIVQQLILVVLSNVADFDETNFVLPVLRWTNCLLHYSLTSSTDLENIYEVFLNSSHNKKLAPILFDILYKLTNGPDVVTRWRINTLINLRSQLGKLHNLENLLRKCRDFRPELIHQQLDPFHWSANATKSSLEASFHCIWNQRDLITASLASETQYGGTGGLKAKLQVWGSTTSSLFVTDQTNGRKRTCAIPRLEDEQPLGKKSRLEISGKAISSCRTMADLYSSLNCLRMPAQSLSLVGSPQTFCLLFLNVKSTEIMERFSMTLYRTLYYEFFSLSCAQGYTQRKQDLLSRINIFQEWLQESIPVVERFLVEYLHVWNGKDFFLEILRLLSYIRITDFDEFNDCILSKIRDHYNNSYNTTEQLLVLTYLNRLCLHWIRLEYPRVKGSMSYSIFSRSARSCICDNPLASISSLVKTLQNLAELGLTKLTYFAPTSLTQPQRSRYLQFFVNEVVGLFTTLSRYLIHVDVPIKPELPPAFIYLSLFGSSASGLSRSLEYLSMIKHELIPLCKRRAADFHKEKNFMDKQVALSQVTNLDLLNDISKDVLATLSSSQVYLDRNHSIFRRYWDLEDEEIRLQLNVSCHPALFPLMLRFVDRELEGQGRRDRSFIFIQLSDEDSELFQKYLTFLKYHLPVLVDSLDTFEFRAKQILTQSHYRREGSIADSNTTSGVSSAKPSRFTRTHRR